MTLRAKICLMTVFLISVGMVSGIASAWNPGGRYCTDQNTTYEDHPPPPPPHPTLLQRARYMAPTYSKAGSGLVACYWMPNPTHPSSPVSGPARRGLKR